MKFAGNFPPPPFPEKCESITLGGNILSRVASDIEKKERKRKRISGGDAGSGFQPGCTTQHPVWITRNKRVSFRPCRWNRYTRFHRPAGKQILFSSKKSKKSCFFGKIGIILREIYNCNRSAERYYFRWNLNKSCENFGWVNKFLRLIFIFNWHGLIKKFI